MLKSASIIVSAVLTLISFSAGAGQQQVGAWAKVEAPTLNVRNAPSLRGTVRSRVTQDDTIFVTPSGEAGWVFIRGESATGYVSAEHIRIIRVTSGGLGDRRVGF